MSRRDACAALVAPRDRLEAVVRARSPGIWARRFRATFAKVENLTSARMAQWITITATENLTSRHANTGDRKTLKGMHMADIAWRGLVKERYEGPGPEEGNVLEVEDSIYLSLLSQRQRSRNFNHLPNLRWRSRCNKRRLKFGQRNQRRPPRWNYLLE